MEKIIAQIRLITTSVVEVCGIVSKAILPVAGLVISADILLGTKFGAYDRLFGMVKSLGITGNVLTVCVLVIVILYLNKKIT